ncbi:MAG: TIGR04282 family arsenosugar biosynthesis glycosyltransferase [Deltaproteobacteria bacterium]|nr:TIGR04282 family arsenosugar biosynthesis glycosyltransferase [Deltaproteobacteria bacterium]
MATHANALVVMAKAPVTGMVKTRLVPPLSPEEAAELYRCLLLDILEGLKSFGAADLFVAFTPVASAPSIKALAPPNFACFAQRGEELGERMYNIFTDLSTKGYRNVIIVGSDLPVLPPRFLEDAFVMLQRSEMSVVLGPSRDGGYYLIGMSQPIAEIFKDMPWGSGLVLFKTVQRLGSLGVIPYFLPPWFDIDKPEDLRYLASLADQFLSHSQNNTFAFLRNWVGWRSKCQK